MAQRLVRAKRRLRVAGIGLRRLARAGHPGASRPGDGGAVPDLQRGLLGLVRRRARPPRAVRRGDPPRPRARAACCRTSRSRLGSSALMLFHHARAPARAGADGVPILLDDQDRRSWDGDMIAQGEAALRGAADAGWVGVYCLQAAIAREHVRAASAADTDWRAIAALYADLADVAPSPVVDLNRAVAVSMGEGPEQGLVLVDRLAARGGACRVPPAAGRPGRHAPPARPNRRGARPSTGARSSSRPGRRSGVPRRPLRRDAGPN